MYRLLDRKSNIIFEQDIKKRNNFIYRIYTETENVLKKKHFDAFYYQSDLWVQVHFQSLCILQSMKRIRLFDLFFNFFLMSHTLGSSITWTVLGHFIMPNLTPKNLTHDNKIFYLVFFSIFFLYSRLILTPNTHA